VITLVVVLWYLHNSSTDETTLFVYVIDTNVYGNCGCYTAVLTQYFNIFATMAVVL